MDQDPTRRFSVRAEIYARYRPSYPPQVAELAERECGLRPGRLVADIGCGTGLLARLFLERGCVVYGIEPNREMRDAGRQALAEFAGFHAVEARAEATTLAAAAVDLVTAGQAAHWFDAEPAHREFSRIVKPGGCLLLVWNEREPAEGFMRDYEALIARHAPEQSRVEPNRISRLFGGKEYRTARFENHQTLDLEGLRGRVASSSYTPPPGTGGHALLMTKVDELFARHQHQNAVRLLYRTEVYYGPLGAVL